MHSLRQVLFLLATQYRKRGEQERRAFQQYARLEKPLVDQEWYLAAAEVELFQSRSSAPVFWFARPRVPRSRGSERAFTPCAPGSDIRLVIMYLQHRRATIRHWRST